eukprot:Gb_24139 [translate_table: standard]
MRQCLEDYAPRLDEEEWREEESRKARPTFYWRIVESDEGVSSEASDKELGTVPSKEKLDSKVAHCDPVPKDDESLTPRIVEEMSMGGYSEKLVEEEGEREPTTSVAEAIKGAMEFIEEYIDKPMERQTIDEQRRFGRLRQKAEKVMAADSRRPLVDRRKLQHQATEERMESVKSTEQEPNKRMPEKADVSTTGVCDDPPIENVEETMEKLSKESMRGPEEEERLDEPTMLKTEPSLIFMVVEESSFGKEKWRSEVVRCSLMKCQRIVNMQKSGKREKTMAAKPCGHGDKGCGKSHQVNGVKTLVKVAGRATKKRQTVTDNREELRKHESKPPRRVPIDKEDKQCPKEMDKARQLEIRKKGKGKAGRSRYRALMAIVIEGQLILTT